ncbi:pyridoxamine 5'-phosphate oxidase family protein [Gillisia sp. M10.2A]|uniref:Pyridoxamine 5'-phosphate oxidase family protein n=1 Tax=Gillisia lutea TaxID=2909668 RepID=A0ABS9EIH5_9FLAO|nr:pyridoxamine 5'-phosphate oxidase family protein [Gillisia lutea]MCF4101268.1 pyridoxamine 5'-phosphate oxidase family protein [Gillisia lutea]
MLNDIFKEIWQELKDASEIKGHPFRFCSLATAEDRTGIRQRTLVLRSISDKGNLLFYTDERSDKVKEITTNPQGNILFYNSEKQLQVSLSGSLQINTNSIEWERHKAKIEGKAVNDYNSKLPPGKPIKNPVRINRVEKLNFALLEFIPTTIEYLKLKSDANHLRARFEMEEEAWSKTFLIP